MILASVTDLLRVVTIAAGTLETVAAWVDLAGSAPTPDRTLTNITGAGTQTIVGAPAVSTKRKIKSVSIRNTGTATQSLSVIQTDGTTTSTILRATLAVGEAVLYEDSRGWYLLDAAGRERGSLLDMAQPVSRVVPYLKIGASKEAAGVGYGYGLTAGFPGAWTPGGAALTGRATEGMLAADAGCMPLWTPAGSLRLLEWTGTSQISEYQELNDVMWVTSGLVVTTLTAQTVNSVVLPARDASGTSDGANVLAALWVSAATTNAAAITNATLSYTNSEGVAGRTATMASFPATAVAGTFVVFQLQAGDKGIRSIQSATLGTSLVTGTVLLVLFRTAASLGVVTANVPATSKPSGSRLFNGTCLLPFAWASATTGANIQGTLAIEDR